MSNTTLPSGTRFVPRTRVGGYTPGGDDEYVETADPEFLAAVGVPEEWRDEPEFWGGWTARTVRRGADEIAGAYRMTGAELIGRAAREADRSAGVGRQRVAPLEAEMEGLAAATARAERLARGRAALAGADQADKVMRYEAHLGRQLTQALDLLGRLRAARAGIPPLPPVAVDVTLDGGVLTVVPDGGGEP